MYHDWNGTDHWAQRWNSPGLFTAHYESGLGPEQVWVAPRPWKGHMTTEQFLEHVRKMHHKRHYIYSEDARIFPVIVINPSWHQTVRNISIKKDFALLPVLLVWSHWSASMWSRFNPLPRAMHSIWWLNVRTSFLACLFIGYRQSFQRLTGIRENDFELAVYGPAFPNEIEGLRRKREDKVLRKKLVYEILESNAFWTKATAWENPLVQRHHAMYLRQISEWDAHRRAEREWSETRVGSKLRWQQDVDPRLADTQDHAKKDAERHLQGTFKPYMAAAGLAGERVPVYAGLPDLQNPQTKLGLGSYPEPPSVLVPNPGPKVFPLGNVGTQPGTPTLHTPAAPPS
eukprot:TRINITY_DN33990_c0_g1_i1.p1 TRINITY_DN33990_c0_g1~~TRINITY_DN33990_c0_g1_i1.p1  ORF type:complete len:343 (-),score=48.91 TRINITY_DN33990_c0_g1_i1:36-1064(-)